jgi:hypothetical protein
MNMDGRRISDGTSAWSGFAVMHSVAAPGAVGHCDWRQCEAADGVGHDKWGEEGSAIGVGHVKARQCEATVGPHVVIHCFERPASKNPDNNLRQQIYPDTLDREPIFEVEDRSNNQLSEP